MATYYHGNPEIQGGDGLQTLILMNPGYVGFSDAQSSNSLVFLNSFAAGNNLASASTLPHAPQQFVGVPVSHAAGASQDPPPPSVNAHQDLSQLHGFLPRPQYNLWNSIDQSAVARDAPRAHQQGLSLSLSPQQPAAAAAAAYGSSYSAAERDHASAPPAGTNTNGMRISGRSSSPASGITNGVSGMQSVLLSSKYLKAAQQLLDEVVNVGNGVKTESSAKRSHGLTRTVGESSASGATGDILMIGGDGTERGSTELTTAERQEIQMKKAKLMGMLDEVEQRYRQYHQQMRMVISTFEQMAGIGSAKTYTALALETISKQFRCLKDAIIAQIRGANKCLGHDESSGARIEGSRLKFVDHQLRQQRALQQLGMMPHNAWRPQRGLPERSVSVLRAWLFEHFLHPYPKDSDKHMLAKQTGLTRSQVSNWFINARVRLWKPMVEEMYLEELKEQESNLQLPDDKSSKSEEDSGSKVTAADKSMIPENPGGNNFISNHQDNSTLPPQPMISMSAAVSSSAASHSGDGYATPAMDGITFTTAANTNTSTTRGSPKKRGSTDSSLLLSPNGGVVPPMNMDVKPGDAMGDLHMKFGGGERQSRDDYSLMSTNYIGGFGSYPMNEIGRFDADPFPPPPRFSGNGSVSLTLGLPHCENGLSLSGAHHQNFIPNHGMQLGRRVDMGDPTGEYCLSATAPPSHSAATPFEDLNLQNRKPFAAQLLPDFVA